MDEDLDLSPKEYSNVASIFYVGYLVFQLPGVLLVRKIGPPYLVRSAAHEMHIMLTESLVRRCNDNLGHDHRLHRRDP